jgi:hypothetical protein
LCRIARLGRIYDGSHNILGVVLHEFFGEHSGTMTRALRHPGRIAGLAFLPLPAVPWRCVVSHFRHQHRSKPYRIIVLCGLSSWTGFAGAAFLPSLRDSNGWRSATSR